MIPTSLINYELEVARLSSSERFRQDLSQTRFLLDYTGKFALTDCNRINNLALPPCPEMPVKNVYTSSLRQIPQGSFKPVRS